MTTDITLTFGNILLAIAIFALLYFLGGVVGAAVPILKALEALVLEKKNLAQTQVASIEKSLAQSDNLVTTLVHDTAASIQISPETGWVITGASVLTEALKTLQQILPIKDEKVTAEEFAEGAQQVAEFVEKLTDKVVGNLPPALG